MIAHLKDIAAVHGSRCLNAFDFTEIGQNRDNRFFFAPAGLSPRDSDDGDIGRNNSGIFNEMRIRIIRLRFEDNNLESGERQGCDVGFMLLEHQPIVGRL